TAVRRVAVLVALFTLAGSATLASAASGAVPEIEKSFAAAFVQPGANHPTTLSFKLSDPSASETLTGVAFTDNLPAGLFIDAPTLLENDCGGTATATVEGTSVSLSGATLKPLTFCTVSVSVFAKTSGTKLNSVTVTSTGGSGNTSEASLIVTEPPTI